MKIQALALGAALGFFAAIAPSCGGTPCSAASCDGCCGKDGKCVAKPNNVNNTTCGTSGNTCADCAATGTTCDSATFACSTGNTGGGSAGGAGGGTAGGAGTCDGCKIGNGTCQQRGSTRQNSNICGSNGETCKACVAPANVCDNGVCVAPAKGVGDSCLTDSECQTNLGPTAVCKQQNSNGEFSYSGGHCTVPNCLAVNGTQVSDTCPMGSVCLNLLYSWGEGRPECFKAVTPCSATACRSGYQCLTVNSMTGEGACLPSGLVSAYLAQGAMGVADGTDKIGQACELQAQCSAPPINGGFCIPEVQRRADGGIVLTRDGGTTPTGNPGGSCSRFCWADEDCTADGTENFAEGICLIRVSTIERACAQGCTGPLLGQSTCRPGYVCEQLTQNDGGALPTGYCEARCEVPGQTCGNYTDGGARLCLPNGYCDFPGRQDAGPTPPPVDAGIVDAGVADAGSMGGGAAGGGAAGGGAAGGGAAGGGAAGGGEAGGSAAGGSAAGGSAAGGSAAGGSAAGGSAAGGSAAGGSAGGGTATTCPDGGAFFTDGGC